MRYLPAHVKTSSIASVVIGLALTVALSSCSLMGEKSGLDTGPTLGQLEPAKLPDKTLPVRRVSLDEVEANYRKVLEVAEDPAIRQKILIRLAGLEMSRAEESLVAEQTDTSKRYFDETIGLYQELIDLSKQESGEDVQAIQEKQDVLYYQLSKAYALDGRLDESIAALDVIAARHPQSNFIAEAEFRRAERAFAHNDYTAAEAGYASVVAVGEENPFHDNAIYMQGWAQFKQNHYRSALRSFTQVLDILTNESPQLADLQGPRKSLRDDTLRVMSLVFSYMAGAESIRDTYAELGARPYEHMLYQQLGDLYLEKRRYRDSADTYLEFVKNYPLSDYAPEFSVRAITVYQQGNFPSLVLPAKQDFVQRYGIHSEYWPLKDEAVHTQLKTHLRLFLRELAEYQHALAQQRQQQEDELQKRQAKGLKVEPLPEKTASGQPLYDSRQHFLLAANWYQEFIDTFPQDIESQEMQFLMAESLFEAEQFARAFVAYEAVAYGFLQNASEGNSLPKRGAAAGYSAILSVDGQLAQLQDSHAPETQDPATLALWQQHKIASGLRFADYYFADPRAVQVLAQISQLQLQLGQPEAAVAAATRVTQWQPKPERDLLYSAWLVLGQGQFDTAHYPQAEVAYQQVLSMLPANDPGRKAVVDRIAASIYKTAEVQQAQDNHSEAIAQLLRIRDVAPGTEIAITAQFDAINQLMTLAAWQQAEVEAQDFRQRYPQHPLTASIRPKLIVIYESTEAWRPAAIELLHVAENDADPEVRRTSLYLAAEYFRRAGDSRSAIEHYRTYAHTYEQPFDQVMEARFILSELYEETGEPDKRRFWLNKLIAGHASAGKQQTQRSNYLAAMAMSVMADDQYQAFERIALTLPIKKSLKNKKSALDASLKAYGKLMDYGVAEFTTLANFRIATIYGQLSRDLMDSERPGNLDAESLEQYEILLEEQAYPFEEQAIQIHEANAQRSWQGVYDDWVKSSFKALSTLMPARYRKQEPVLEVSDDIY